MPALTIDKSADVSTYDAVDDVITYTYVVRNTGNLTLTNVTVEDDNIDAGSLDPASVATLAPGAEATFTATRTITQTDLDEGSVVNVAYATDGTTDSPTDTETVTLNNLPPSITCPTMPAIIPCSQEVSGLAPIFSDPNNNIESLTWTMTGATVASSPATGINILDTYTFQWGTTTVTYTVTDALGLTESCSFTVTVTPCGEGDGYCTYTQGFYGNTGGKTCDGLTAYDLMVNAFGGGTITSQLFGLESTGFNFTLYYTDITNRSIFDMLPGGAASQALTGSATYSARNTWRYVPISNSGTINNNLLAQTMVLWFNMKNDPGLANLMITDNIIVTVESTSCGEGDPVYGTEWYTEIPQSVLDHFGGEGFTVNELFALANRVLGGSNEGISASDVQMAVDAINNAFDECRILTGFEDARPSLTITKTSTTSPNTFDEAGDILTYNLVVQNTGNVTLTNIIVSDPIASVSGSPVGSLKPGASITLNASYTVTVADVTAGKVINTATATTTYGNTVVSDNDDEIITATLMPDLSITKVATEESYSAVGDKINYTIVVTNTGNVNLTDVVVTDPLTGLNQTIASLLTGASNAVTINTVYTVDSDDLVAGKVDNTAKAAFSYDGKDYYEEASESVPMLPVSNPALTITKVATEDNYSAVGDKINYTIVVTNTGNVNLADVVVTDPLTGLNQTIASLLTGPSNAVTINTVYTVDSDDLVAGKVDNTARAAFSYGGKDYFEEASESVPMLPVFNPALTVSKDATEDSFAAEGDEIHYTIVVTNTGDVTLTNVLVTDPLTGLSQTIATLLPGSGNAVTINTTYEVTPADLVAGKVDNTAMASTMFGDTEVKDTDDETVTGVTNKPPVIKCPVPVVTSCSQIVSGLNAIYSDPDGEIESITWSMTGATTASGTGNLDNYTFNWGSTTVTYTVTDKGGLSASCSFSVTVSQCCETAYGYLGETSICFLDAPKNYKFTNWGWTSPLKGDGPWTLELWAGAGGCNRADGYLAGYVYVSRDATDRTKITVTYDLNQGYVLSEANAFVGCDAYPKLSNGKYTVAPGAYTFGSGNLNMVSDLSVDFSGVTGDFYLIAHAVTCKTDVSFYNPVSFGVVDSKYQCPNTVSGKTKSLSVESFEPYELNIYPNPFTDVASFELTMLYDSHVKIEIFRQNGSLVRVILNEDLKQGDIRVVEFDGTRYPRTSFIFRITTQYSDKSGTLLRIK
ncbi:MAG: HYR domain-containing protein, partial [Bacteroidales bacterium]|jgi:uncharacterized repeat protein (TIGR01451 family)|nr:HYR domain-containing protein [Bacteroidales bacterium]